MYTDSQSSMHFIEYNKENLLMLNQIYDILAELRNQGKQILLCKILAHIEIKRNEESDKNSKTSNRYPRNDHNNITLYILLSQHQKT